MTVEMPDPDCFLTSQVPHLPRALFRVLPSMAMHTCHNDNGISFRKECQCTEIPHLFEHLVLELQAQAQSIAWLRGETEWDWLVNPRGYYVVTVDYDNELLVIGAIKLAERMIVALNNKRVETLKMPVEIARLRELARIGREIDSPVFGFSAGDRVGAEVVTEAPVPAPRVRRRVSRRSWDNVPLRPVRQEAVLREYAAA